MITVATPAQAGPAEDAYVAGYATAVLERLPVTFDGDLQSPAWGRDGTLLAVGVSIRSSLWRFQAQVAQPK